MLRKKNNKVVLPPIWEAALLIDSILVDLYGMTTVTITSGNDGKHGERSLHYKWQALDFRTFDWPRGKSAEIVANIRRRLGKDYDVVLESDHLHVEYDPK